MQSVKSNVMPTFRDSVENSILESRLVLAWVVSVEVLVLVDPHLLFFAGFSWGSSGAFFCAVLSEKRLIHMQYIYWYIMLIQ